MRNDTCIPHLDADDYSAGVGKKATTRPFSMY